MMIIRTIGELKNLIKNLPNDTPIAKYHCDIEQDGYLPMLRVRLENMVLEEKETRDACDYTPYTYEVFSPTHDDTGTLCFLVGQ